MRIGRWRLLLGFVSLIPLLMTLFGRYAFCYSWLLSIPTMVCFVALLAEGGFVRLATPLRVGLCAVLLSVPQGFRYWVNYLKNTPALWEQNERTSDFVRSQSATLAKFENVFATDPVAYYPLTALGKRLYVFQYDNVESLTVFADRPEEHLRSTNCCTSVSDIEVAPPKCGSRCVCSESW